MLYAGFQCFDLNLLGNSSFGSTSMDKMSSSGRYVNICEKIGDVRSNHD